MTALIGYIASAIVVVSLVMTSVLRLRLVSFVGAILWCVYGLLLNSPPIILTNAIIIAINAWFLFKMLTEKHYFRLLEIDHDSSYLRNFLDFHSADIGRFFPQFKYNAAEADLVYLILRDMLPVGLLVTEQDSVGRHIVKIDYVITGYRDLQAGSYLYRELAMQLPPRGVHVLYSVPGSDKHQAYLTRMGFAPVHEKTTDALWQREMG
jgi:hypothetical protein